MAAKRYYSLTDILNDPNLYRIVVDYITANDVTVKEFWPWIKSLGYTISRTKAGQVLAYFMEQGIVYNKGSKYKCPCGYRTDSQKHYSSHAQTCPWYRTMMDLAKNDILTMEYVADQIMNHNKVNCDIVKDLIRQFKFPVNIEPGLMVHVKNQIRKGINNGLIDKDHYDMLIKKAWHERSKETIKKKYGVENISQLEEIKQKKRETCRKHFGVDYSQQSPEVRAKTVATVRKKYGVDNVSQAPQVKLKKAKTFEEHYGIDNIFRNREYIQQAWKEKLGVDNPTKRPDIKAKAIGSSIQTRKNLISPEEYKLVDDLKIFLDKISIKYNLIHNKKVIHIADYVFVPDIIIETDKANIIIEYQNDYHRCAQQRYRDRKRFEILRSQGYKVFEIWPKTYNEDLTKVKDYIKSLALQR